MFYYLKGQNLKDIITELRKNMKNLRIIERNAHISYEMSNKIVDIICIELQYNDNIFHVCKNIVYKLDHEFGSSWSCLVQFKYSAQDFSPCSSFVKVMFGSVIFKVCRSKYVNIPTIFRFNFRITSLYILI